MMEKYDPNIRWAKQTVEVTLMQWEYQTKLTTVVGGNCKGFEIFEAAIGNLTEELMGEVYLTDAEGEQLECTDDDEEYEDWLKKMVVEIRIIKQEEEKK